MNNNEEILKLLDEFLICAEEVRKELEVDLANIENPKIPTKKKVKAKMRLINNIIYTATNTKESLLAEQNNLIRKRKK